MTIRSRIGTMVALEAPTVEPINLQVRTGMSVPFARHMLATAEAPSVEPINLQVRTGMSVPFASYMVETTSPSTQTQTKPKT